MKFEYLNEAGEWKEVPNAEGLGCEKDKYNTTKLGNIKTKAIRMVMEPEFLSDADPAHGIGRHLQKHLKKQRQQLLIILLRRRQQILQEQIF